MLVQGIVAEYNPLHEGHAWHIAESARVSGATHTVVVLSSQFVQRGEAAFLPKHVRAEMALLAGADLVLELPVAFSCASAEDFAAGAVSVLNATGLVDRLAFGSESGTLSPLDEAAAVLADETEAYRHALREGLKSGLSFPRARTAALERIGVDSEAAGTPNNNLGIEYLKALRRTGSAMKPVTIARAGEGYHSTAIDRPFASATAIRQAWRNAVGTTENRFEAIRTSLPEAVRPSLLRAMAEGIGPIRSTAFDDILLYLLRTSDEARLRRCPWSGDGLAERLLTLAPAAADLQTLLSEANSSRHPTARVRRMLNALLIGLEDSLLHEARQAGYAQYLRVLGFRESARPLLARMKKSASLPILVKPAAGRRFEDRIAKALFALEVRATSVLALGMPDPGRRSDYREMRLSPVMLQE